MNIPAHLSQGIHLGVDGSAPGDTHKFIHSNGSAGGGNQSIKDDPALTAWLGIAARLHDIAPFLAE
ncbi:hypothetical protein [Oceaniferula spumae]|uniref:hypothetical protein n=1 Tax=Oceaniferula spumae TaxID=2979115 RepID=UPI003F4F0091